MVAILKELFIWILNWAISAYWHIEVIAQNSISEMCFWMNELSIISISAEPNPERLLHISDLHNIQKPWHSVYVTWSISIIFF